MKKLSSYQHTKYACYIGYVTQAIVNNFLPLLFLTFQRTFQISLSQIAVLVSVNFGVQLVVDFSSSLFVDRVGYRNCMKAAHLLAAAGLAGLFLFPELFPVPFYGIIAAVILYAIGGGLLEVLVCPIVEACPCKPEEKAA